ncbi:MAG: hypothetical protein KBB83_01820 [Alphaproteobacteria bacterium]|nr:hypothetical protein [Alphaproteobacteria bacterium]
MTYKKYILRASLVLSVVFAVAGFMWLKDYSSLLSFRTSTSAYQWWTFSGADRRGLDDLRISGSGVLHEKAFVSSLKSAGIPLDKVYVLDLAGNDFLFANGRPLRWFNWVQTDNGIEEPYKPVRGLVSLNDNAKWFFRRLWYPRPEQSIVETEEEMVRRLGCQYFRFAVNRRQVYPPETIDRFMAFVTSLPQDVWLHFHCNGGNSRTTTMMILYDIIRNGSHVPLETILERQYALGGVDVRDTRVYWNGTYEKQMLVMRKTMIEDFYRYRQDPHGFGQTSWTEWFAQHGTAKDPEV